MVIVGSGMTGGIRQLLFTAASMVAAVNAILVGAGLAFLLDGAGRPVAVAVGLVAALVVFGLHLAHQARRFAAEVGAHTEAPAGSASSTRLR